MPSLTDRINSYVEEYLTDYQPRLYRSSKVIHDSLWGTSRFYPHELILIDSPLFQRLRGINQTGLAFFAYPSLNHSRFEHSLGVATVVKRFLRKLREKHQLESRASELFPDNPTAGIFAEMRLAALLHDIGHGTFSHLSEEIFQWHKEVQELLDEPRFSRSKPSEVFAYLMVTSEAFSKFFECSIKPLTTEVSLQRIADLIIGQADPGREFAAQVINGALDADKIDYISRDTFYSGISTTIDVDRIFNEISVHDYPTGETTLVVTSSTALERLLFSKILLYSSIYHHQKVKAADCMVSGLIEYVMETPDVSLCSVNFRDPLDFLRISDNDFFAHSTVEHTDSFVRKTISGLLDRSLLQRCLVLSRETIDNYESSVYELNRISQSPVLVRQLRNMIADEIPESASCSVHEIWVSLPPQPSLREASQTLVISPLGELVSLNELFPLDGWLRAFSDNKWRGHVFAPPHVQALVHRAASKVFTDVLKIRLNAKSSAYAHVKDEVIT